MSVQALREFMNRQMTAATGLAALAAALDAKASGQPLDPSLDTRVQAFLSTLGVGDALAGVNAEQAKPLVAEIRAMSALDSKLLDARTRSTAWSYTDES